MFKVAWKSLLDRKLRLLLSTSAIVLGVAFVAGSLVFSDTLERSFTGLFDTTVGDVVVRPEGSQDGVSSSVTIPAAVVDRLAQVPGAARADGNVVEENGVFVVGTDGKVVGGQGAPAIGVNDTDAPAAHGRVGLTVVRGERPSGPGEVVLDEVTAEKAGLGIGDTATILTPGAQPVVRATVVGLAGYPDGGSLNGASVTVFDTATAQQLFLGGKDEYSSIWVTAEDGVSQTELRDAVREVLPADLTAVTGDKAADDAASELLQAISFIRYFLLVFAAIALVVGAFLIFNTFTILVAQRSRELALLRAMGASRPQVTVSVLVEALALGVVGSTLGLGVGVLLALGIKALFRAVFGLEMGAQLTFLPLTVVASYAVGIVVTMVAATIPAVRTGRIAPVQALSDDVAMPAGSMARRLVVALVLTVVGAAAMLAALFGDVPQPLWVLGLGMLGVLLGVAGLGPWLIRPFLTMARAGYARLFGAVGNLAAQNSLRNPRRTSATAAALMIGLAVATLMVIIAASMKATVDDVVAEDFRGDYVVSHAYGQPFSPTIAGEVADVPGVTEVVAERFQWGIEVAGETVSMSAADPRKLASVLDLTIERGRLGDLADGTLMVSDTYAADHDLAVGDRVRATMQTGLQTYPVVGVFEDHPFVGSPFLTTPKTLLDAGFKNQDNYLIVTADPVSAVTQRAIEKAVSDSPIITVKDQAGFAEEQRQPVDQLLAIVFALLGLAMLIAVLGIVNTLALSVIERTREVGLLRAVGLSRPQLRRMITLESVVIAFLGALLGIAVGIGFGLALMSKLRDEGLTVTSVPFGQLAAFLAVSLVVGVLAAVLPARRAAKLDVLKAIATE